MSPREMFAKGDRLGDYEIVRQLRAGGMATLFLARRIGVAGVSRPVAIKIVHPHLSEDEVIIKMFIDEARISSHISHSNVVGLEAFGEHEGIYFIAMEYVEGCSLEQLSRTLVRRKEYLPTEIAVHIATEVAAGLHAAHETVDENGRLLGIVHRDVSPSNVLIAADGRIKVIDFGIAKARNRLGATRSGSGLKGKVRYMSPEQAYGQTLDRRSDVYSLGVVLWELLTLRALFRADNDMELLELVRMPSIEPPSKINERIPPEVDAVVMRAMARDPADRQATALELRQELMRALPGALAIPAELLSPLVASVRGTLGTKDLDPERATTLASPTPSKQTPGSKPPGGGPSSNPSMAGRGQVEETRRTRSRLLPGVGIALGCAIAGFVTSRLVGGSGSPAGGAEGPAHNSAQMPIAPAEAPADAAVVQMTPVLPVDAALEAAVPIDAADAPTTAPTPNHTQQKPHVPTRPTDKTKTQPKPHEVEVDGTVLAP